MQEDLEALSVEMEMEMVLVMRRDVVMVICGAAPFLQWPSRGRFYLSDGQPDLEGKM